jgi:hypothetical protein
VLLATTDGLTLLASYPHLLRQPIKTLWQWTFNVQTDGDSGEGARGPSVGSGDLW